MATPVTASVYNQRGGKHYVYQDGGQQFGDQPALERYDSGDQEVLERHDSGIKGT